MEAKQWTFVDKSTWGEGPWQTEPDKAQWRDEATGLACLIHRSVVTGALCGYVGVPPGHPLFGKFYGDNDLPELDVHGGLTFSDACQGQEADGGGICHLAPGEPDVWWFGFDCAHLWDHSPAMHARMAARGMADDYYGHRGESYKTEAYVRNEVARLAAQLAEVRA